MGARASTGWPGAVGIHGNIGGKMRKDRGVGERELRRGRETVFRPNNSLRASPGFGLIARRHISQ